jgi:hypothetical protein
MTTGLSVNRVVNVDIVMSPTAAARRNFGVLCIAGDSDVIDGLERIRSYTTLEEVASDFGLDAPEYAAANLYFSQKPKPKLLKIGRWIQKASAAILRGGVAETDVPTWAAVSDGAMKIEVDGVEASLTALDFSEQTNLNGVASVISTALAGAGQSGAVCTWDGSRFVITTVSTGATAFLGHATSPAAGTDISAMTGLTAVLAYTPIPGYDAETPAECTAQLADSGNGWYGLMFAASGAITDDAHLEVAALIEASSKSRIYGVTVSDERMLSSAFTTDLATRLDELGYDRTFTIYSSGSDVAAASMFGRAFTVNFSGSKTTLTLKFKQLPGVAAETLKESEAAALEAKHCNVFVNYDNDTAILQEGVMASGVFFDEVHGLDWLENAVQAGVFNLLYQSTTKVPQTEEGVTRMRTRISKVMTGAVTNGLIAPGVWNADPFGDLEEGQYLADGYYIYSQPIVDQDQSEREQRKAPPIQCAVKLAGAVHFSDIIINVNR